MEGKRILLLGGTGFIGTAIAQQLCANGDFVTVATRHAARAQHLRVLPTCEVVVADVYDVGALKKLIANADAVINLIGILHGDFIRAHVTLPASIATICAAFGVPRLIHMSALGADVSGPSAYQRSRGEGEASVRAALAGAACGVTIFRPSVVFGAGDKFINLFAELSTLFPVIPLGSPEARFQPVWVEDVARAIVRCLDLPETIGATYPLVGPKVYTLRALVQFAASTRARKPLLLGLGEALSMLQATLFQYLPGKIITTDNVRSMRVPNISTIPFPALFGAPASLETVFATRNTDPTVRLMTLRECAGRTLK